MKPFFFYSSATQLSYTMYFYYLLHYLHVNYFLLLEKHVVVVDPCYPSPCGPNSKCRVIGETAVCSCIENYVGRPPNCRPECTLNSECPRNLACINDKCKDPCPGSCGSYTTCTVNNHQPICTCYEQYTGDPFSSCSPIISKEKKKKKNMSILLLLYCIHSIPIIICTS